jgi:hypothetical protein
MQIQTPFSVLKLHLMLPRHSHSQLRHSQLRHSQLRHSQLRHSQLRHSQLRHSQLRHKCVLKLIALTEDVVTLQADFALPFLVDVPVSLDSADNDSIHFSMNILEIEENYVNC